MTEHGRQDNQGRRFDSDGNRVEHNLIAWNANGAIYLSSDVGNVSDKNVYWGDGVASRFSVNYPSPTNQPVYGIEAWTKRSRQDARSWWLHAPMSAAAQAYLSARSTARAPLLDWLKEARQRPSSEQVILGSGLSRWSGESAIPAVGPRHLKP